MAQTSNGKVFISYSHKDTAYLDRLQEHLTPYVRGGAIPLWVDTQIKPGDDWHEKIEEALESAQVAILLVSVSFLASSFVADEELPKLLAAAKERGLVILPVVVTPCNFPRTGLSRFQAVNNPVKPLNGQSEYEQDLVWEKVVNAVMDAINTSAPAPAAPPPPKAPPDPTPRKPPKAAPVTDPAPQPQPKAAKAPAQRDQSPTHGRLITTYRGHSESVDALAWSPDSRLLASGGGDFAGVGGSDYTVQVWEAATGKPVTTFDGHKGRLTDIAWSPDGKRIASCAYDGTALIWTPTPGLKLYSTYTYTSSLKSPLLSLKSPLLAASRPEAVYALSWSPDGKYIVLSGSTNWRGIHLIESARATLIRYLDTIPSVAQLAWAPRGNHIATGNHEGTVEVFDAETGKRLLSITGHTAPVTAVAWSPDGKRLASASHDKTARVWDAATGQPICLCQAQKDPRREVDWMNGLDWSPRGDALVSCGTDGLVQVWDARTGQPRFAYRSAASVLAVAWSPDGACIAFTGEKHRVHVWQVE